ncbi:EamA family transporter [Abyssalbus ytuae]|uniref:EamA family transporter n=1 Tax=Abyssalbus ytuae TaxID=2926907 RepID=A0A9E6ZYT4_9FLAO|nr:EamA family transporter [Abyssalbus ytuae]UOB17692.1 EamA family transporter [Abyssalbus ytuae]
MTSLIFSVLLSTLLFVIFKLFAKYNINVLQAIVVNYIVACVFGLILYPESYSISDIPARPWFMGAFLLGFLFISVFNIMAATSQKNGLSVASVAGKMSVVIPIIFGVIIYSEQLGIIKIAGIILALIAVYLVSVKEGGIHIKKNQLIYPVLLFLGSGIIDTSLKYFETNYVGKNEIPLFSATIFAFAAIAGIIILAYKVFVKNELITLKNILGGICLGIFNYYSIYYLIKALRSDSLNSAAVFTINNVAIVMLTTIVGILLFREKLIPKNWVGIFIAVISIVLVAFS